MNNQFTPCDCDNANKLQAKIVLNNGITLNILIDLECSTAEFDYPDKSFIDTADPEQYKQLFSKVDFPEAQHFGTQLNEEQCSIIKYILN